MPASPRHPTAKTHPKPSYAPETAKQAKTRGKAAEAAHVARKAAGRAARRLHPARTTAGGAKHLQQHHHEPPHKPLPLYNAPIGGQGGGSTGTNLPGSGYFGPNPPNTTNHWLANVGHEITATPAMVGVALDLYHVGYYARRQAQANANRIGHKRSVV